MKKIIALLLALSMVFALTACEKVDKNTSTHVGTEESTQSTTEETDSTEETTATDSTDSTIEPSETPSMETCEHDYLTDGLTDCKGILTYICSICQDSYEVETGKIDHKWENKYTKQPTLKEEGVLCRECLECHLIETESVGKLYPDCNVYLQHLYCFLESDSPLNTELYTWQGKAKGILYARYPSEITEEELFTPRRCWEFDISNEEIEKIKTTAHYNSSNNMFISYDEGTHPPVYTSYLGYTDNGDGTVTAYASIEIRDGEDMFANYVESDFCKIQMKYVAPPSNNYTGTYYITSIMRVESIPDNIIN